MTELSTDRLDPASRVPEVQGQQPRRDSPSKERRRETPPSKSPECEPAPEPEGPPHQVDRLA